MQTYMSLYMYIYIYVFLLIEFIIKTCSLPSDIYSLVRYLRAIENSIRTSLLKSKVDLFKRNLLIIHKRTKGRHLYSGIMKKALA